MATGLSDDISDSPQASCLPEPFKDPLADIFKDAILRWKGNLPATLEEMRLIFFHLIELGMVEAEQNGYTNPETSQTLDAIGELLNLLKDVSNSRLYVYALLIVLGRIGESEEVIACKLGVTKAAVSKAKIAVQDFYNIPSRTGRKESSRKAFTEVALDRGCRKPVEWKGARLFLQPILS